MILQCKKVNFSSIRTDGKKVHHISFDRAWRALSIAQLISFKNVHFRKKKFDIMDNMLPTGLVSGYFNHSISILPSKWIWYSESASKTESYSIFFYGKKKFFSKIACLRDDKWNYFKKAEGGYRCNFDRIFFRQKNILLDLVFDADSEYHMHFDSKWK